MAQSQSRLDALLLFLAKRQNFSRNPILQRVSAVSALQRGADPNGGPDASVGSPLYWSVRMGNHELSELLLQHGADPARRVEPQGWTPLMAAAWKHDDPRYVELLLGKLGPDAHMQLLSARDEEGRSALWFALDKRHINAAASLMALGADATEERSHFPSSWWRIKKNARCQQLIEEADRVVSLVKLRTIADQGAECTSQGIKTIFEGRRAAAGQQPAPAVEYHAEAVAAAKPKPSVRGRGWKRKWGHKGQQQQQPEQEEGGKGMQCFGTVLAHVCEALPQELFVELMGFWGPEHFQPGY